MSQLSAKITADVSSYKKALNEAKNILKTFTKEESVTAQTMRKVYDVTQDQVRAFQKVTDNIEKATDGTKSNKAAASALSKEIEKLKMQWSNLSETARQSDFGKGMMNTIRATEERMRQLHNTSNALSGGMSSLHNSATASSSAFMNLAGTFTRFAGPAALVTSAFNTLKDAFMSTESNIDSFNRKMEGAKSVYKSFLNSLRSGNFSSFSIASAFGKGEEAYNASDDLDTYGGVNVLFKQNLLRRIADLDARRAEGEKIDASELDEIRKSGRDYYSRLGAKASHAAWMEFRKSWNSTEMKFEDERVQQILERIKSGNTNVDDVLSDNAYSESESLARVKRIRSLQSEMRKLERNDLIDPSKGYNFDNFEIVITDEEKYKRLKEEIQKLEEEDWKDWEGFSENFAKSAIRENEVALREYIQALQQVKAEETEWSRIEKKLARLSKGTEEKKTSAVPAQVEKQYVDGSVGYYQEMISKANSELKDAIDNKTVEAIKSRINEFQDKLDELLGNKPTYAFKYQFVQYNRQDKSNEANFEKYDTKKHLSAINSETAAVGGLANAWASVGKAMEEGDPSSILSAMSNGLQQTVSSVMQFAEASKQAAEMQRIASLSTVAASEGEALSKGAASSAGLPFPYNLAAIATVVASIMATFSTITSVSRQKKFAHGGLVYGPTNALIGEGATTNHNNPEVVAPLDKLRGMLDVNSGISGDVTFRIDGRTLTGILKKENNLTSRR